MAKVLVVCPYDDSHQIEPLRMPQHLLKCRKNHPDMEMSICPYNASHEVKKAEFLYHITNCPNRSLLEKNYSRNIFGDSHVQEKGCTDLPCVSQRRRQEELEDDEWDRDMARAREPPLPRAEHMGGLGARPRTRRWRDDKQPRLPTTRTEAYLPPREPNQDTPNRSSIVNSFPTHIENSSTETSPSAVPFKTETFVTKTSPPVFIEKTVKDQSCVGRGRAALLLEPGCKPGLAAPSKGTADQPESRPIELSEDINNRLSIIQSSPTHIKNSITETSPSTVPLETATCITETSPPTVMNRFLVGRGRAALLLEPGCKPGLAAPSRGPVDQSSSRPGIMAASSLSSQGGCIVLPTVARGRAVLLMNKLRS